MKKIHYVVILLFFMFACIFFLPHKNLLYLAENLLSKNKITISQEILNQKIFGLDIKNIAVSYDEIKAGTIENATIDIYGVYNKLTINTATIDTKNFSSIPKNIKIFEAKYSLLSPATIELYSENDLGIIDGYLSLRTQKLVLELHPSKEAKSKYNTILKFFKVQKEGLYTYETNIKLY